MKHKSSIFGWNANIVAVLAYVLGFCFGFAPYASFAAFLCPLLIYLFEKKSNFVRFHAMQSLVMFAISSVLSLAAFVLTLILPFLSFLHWIISAIFFILAVVAIIKAAQWSEFELPFIGSLSRRIMKTF